MTGPWTQGWDEPPEYKVPNCPICGWETDVLYRNKATGDILGCENCIEEVDAWDYEWEVNHS